MDSDRGLWRPARRRGEWRQRQIDELDRDYDDYRRENQSRSKATSNWRERQGKRQLLGQIREHMEVVGSDDEHVGTGRPRRRRPHHPDQVDPPRRRHHSLSCTMIDRSRRPVILDKSAEQAKQRWRDESRDRALFEREDQGEPPARTCSTAASRAPTLDRLPPLPSGGEPGPAVLPFAAGPFACPRAGRGLSVANAPRRRTWPAPGI
jgi:hypothetical protein